MESFCLELQVNSYHFCLPLFVSAYLYLWKQSFLRALKWDVELLLATSVSRVSIFSIKHCAEFFSLVNLHFVCKPVVWSFQVQTHFTNIRSWNVVKFFLGHLQGSNNTSMKLKNFLQNCFWQTDERAAADRAIFVYTCQTNQNVTMFSMTCRTKMSTECFEVLFRLFPEV